MARFLRWLLLAFAALVLTAIFEPPLMVFFAGLGWHEQPKSIPSDLLNWLSDIVGVQSFPWVAGAGLGLAVGAWSQWLAGRIDRGRPTRADQFSDMYHLIGNVKDEWLDGFKDDFGNVDFSRTNYKTDLRRKVLYEKLGKVGLVVPDFSNLSRLEANVGHYTFMQMLEPFSQYGLIKEAKRESRKTISEIKSASQQLQLKQGSEEETQR